MSKGIENMEVSGTIDTENEYFQGVGGLDDSTDRSIDSMQGSLSLPTFTMNQSSVLHGSHGFQVSQGSDSSVNASSVKSDEWSSYKQTTGSGHVTGVGSGHVTSAGSGHVTRAGSGHVTSAGSGHVTGAGSGHVTSAITMGTPQYLSSIEHVTSGTTISGSTLIFSNSQLGALNVLTAADQFQLVLPKDSQDKGQSQYSKIMVKTETVEGGPGNTGGSDHVEGGSSDEKSGKCKASPKRRGRKSRSTSSAGNEMNVKSESVTGPSPEPQQPTSDVGIKPSLLDEILTEKKMGLLRSPEVLKFLQSQQQLIEKEKKITHRKSIDS